jgi:hypothetical protein
MPAPRRLSYSELQRINAALRQRIAELEAPPPAPKIPLKRAAFNAGVRLERLRRACEAGKVDGEQLGHKRNGPWVVDEQSLANYLRQTR